METIKYPPCPVLLVDDEPFFLESCEIILRTSGVNNTISLRDSREVMPLLASRDTELILLDISMPHLSGKELLPKVVQEYPGVPVIILTGVDEVDTAVECMKSGAFDYMVKPVEESHLASAVKRAIELRELKRENTALRQYLLSDNLEHPDAFSDIITNNAGMRAIFQYVESIAGSNRPALVNGETGVGKELIAKAIHNISGRNGAFVPVNIAGLDDVVFADTLFGHKKGAFTGADQARNGLIECASGGTLFLDEIGDLEKKSQVKLLRLLQEGEYYSLGSDVTKKSDARIIVATNQDLEILQKEGGFRKDLFFRLCAHQITIPPLRARKDDIPLLTEHFLKKASSQLNKNKPHCPVELYTFLKTYNFPGNIRELESLVHDAVSRPHRGTLSLDSFRQYITVKRGVSSQNMDGVPKTGSEPQAPFELREGVHGEFPTLKEAENYLVTEALKKANGNQTIAAEMLGLTRSALNKRLTRK